MVGCIAKQLAATLLVLAALACVADATSRKGYRSDGITILTFVETAAEADREVFPANPIPGKTDPKFGQGGVYDSGVLVKGKEVGRSTGFYFFDSIYGGVQQYIFDITFTKGAYKASSLTFGGRFFFNNPVNEFPVTGGTGIFKFVTGSAVYTTLPTGDYDVKVSLKGVLPK